MRANYDSLAVSKLVTTKDGKIAVQIAGAVAYIHYASQLLVANDQHLEMLPAEKVSIRTSVAESSQTRR